MIDATHELPIVRQAQLLDLARSTVYYQPQPTSDADLALMRRMDELHLEHPFAGSRMLRDMLNREGIPVGRKHVATLMRRMGIEALYQRPRTSGRHREHPVFPYLLRGVTIDRPNQVWAMDTTYIPMRRGFVYLTVVLDWASRRVLHGWQGLLARQRVRRAAVEIGQVRARLSPCLRDHVRRPNEAGRLPRLLQRPPAALQS